MDSHSTSGKEAETARGSAFLVDIQPVRDSEDVEHRRLGRPDCFALNCFAVCVVSGNKVMDIQPFSRYPRLEQ